MLESCGEETDEAKVEVLKREPFSNKSTWAERSTEEKNTELNFRNSATKLHFSPATSEHSIGNIMEETRNDAFKEDSVRDSVIQERHFLPVKEEEEEEEEAGDEDEKLEHNVTHEIPSESSNSNLMVREHAGSNAEINWSHTGFVPAGNQLNDCHSTSGPQIVSSPTSKQSPATTNRTARPFFSPPPVCSPEVVSPVTEIPPPPSYSTPPLPAFTIPQPVTFSPPPPPSYPTPPLPAFKSLPPETCCSCPPPLSPSMSTSSAPPSQFSVSHYPPMPQYGPPTAPRPSTFVPQPTAEKKMTTSIKTGILEQSAAKRTNKKSMFTFKEKPVLAPNPELLSLVQGVDEKKKPGQRSVPEPSSEEELLALGAEASNFLTKEEDMLEEARAPEWASCLKSSRTRPRTEHRPEHTLTNVSGKGAELFAKRQSRMEKYVIEKQNSAQLRSPSPTMSLPPSWVYPSNMPGRVKAIAKNSDMSAQLSQNLKAQQISKQNPRQKAAVPEPAPEPPPLENGCSKIEMDLSRHRPYQLNSSLFILNPVKDPLSTLPKGAPQARNLHPTQPLTRKTSLPNNATSFFKCMSPQMPVCPAGVPEHPFGSASSHPRISSPLSAFPPERVSSPRSGAQAPRPTFSAKKAGIALQTPKDFLTNDTASETSRITRTPSLTRHISSKEDSTTASWTSSLQRNRPSTTASCSIRSVSSPITSANSTSCQSPVINQNIKVSSPTSTLSSRPFQTPTSPSPCSPIWGSKCQSPLVGPPPTSSSTLPFRPFQTHDATSQISSSSSKRCPSPMLNRNTKSPTAISFSTSRPFQTASSPCSPLPWESRCLSPSLNQNVHPNVSPLPTSRRPQTFVTSSARSPSPWGSRCQSPVANQNTQFSSMSVFTSNASQTLPTSPVSPTWSSRSLSPSVFQTTLSFPVTKPLYTSSVTSPTHTTKDSRCMSPDANGQDSKANHRLLAKNIINAAKRKNSPSPGALSNRSLPISPLGNSQPGFDSQKPPISPYHSRALGVQSPTFTSPPPTPSQRTCSPARLYNTRSLTDSDASVESEDSGLRSPGLRSYNTSPRGWGGSFRVKRSTISTDL
ncbi:mucin-5AC isoform X2 [Gouania willdenowi]|nr:synaptopodin isoform X2 [Gouania willdenowi]XP_028315558.1 synaptopodin isoform X2 [Gouania willdenowi]